MAESTSVDQTTRVLVAYCAVCGCGRIGREQRLRRWTSNHYGRTGHEITIKPLAVRR